MNSQKTSAIQKKKRSNAKALESDSPTQKCFCIVTISVIHLIQKQNLSFIQNHFCQNTYIFSLSFPLIYFPSQIFTNLLGIQKQNLSFNLEYFMKGAILGRLKAVETEDADTEDASTCESGTTNAHFQVREYLGGEINEGERQGKYKQGKV